MMLFEQRVALTNPLHVITTAVDVVSAAIQLGTEWRTLCSPNFCERLGWERNEADAWILIKWLTTLLPLPCSVYLRSFHTYLSVSQIS